MPTGSLESRIAHVAALTTCRFCSQVVQSDVVLCPCRVARGEIPHTEWGGDVKRFLCVRTVDRKRVQFVTEQEFWTRMVTGLYAGTTQGAGPSATILHMSASLIECFPYAARDAIAWAESGRPMRFTI